MRLVDYRCPNCTTISTAPISPVFPGDAGFWQCGGCGKTYRLRIDFKVIDEQTMEAVRAKWNIDAIDADNELDSPPRCEEIDERLLEIDAEMETLRRCIEDLEAEATRLHEEEEAS